LKDLKIPYCVHFHGVDASKYFSSKIYLDEIRKVFINAFKVVVMSNHIKRRLILAGCKEEKISLVPVAKYFENDLPQCNWAFRKRNLPSILSIGRLVEKKNPLALLYAFKIVKEKIPEAILTFIGDGPLKNELESRIIQLNLTKSVHLLGALEHKLAMQYFKSHWVYAQHCCTASNGDQEGFNNTMVEAASCGLPIVSTFHDGIPENVDNGENGFLVSEYDFEAMAEKIIILLNDTDLAEKMGQNGFKKYQKGFGVEIRVEKIANLLKSSMNESL